MKEGKMYICPYCGKDRNSPEAKKNIINLLKSNTLSFQERINPGGREIIINGSQRIMLHDQCNWCDYETIKKELSK